MNTNSPTADTDSSTKTPRREALEQARDNIDSWRRLANSDLPIAPYARNLVNTAEDEFPEVGTDSPPSPDGQSEQFCPACGEAVEAEDAFCRHCGDALSVSGDEDGC